MNIYNLEYDQLRELKRRLNDKLEGKDRWKYLEMSWVRDRVSVALNNKSFYGEDYG